MTTQTFLKMKTGKRWESEDGQLVRAHIKQLAVPPSQYLLYCLVLLIKLLAVLREYFIGTSYDNVECRFQLPFYLPPAIWQPFGIM